MATEIEWSSTGSEFHADGAATVNALSAKRLLVPGVE